MPWHSAEEDLTGAASDDTKVRWVLTHLAFTPPGRRIFSRCGPAFVGFRLARRAWLGDKGAMSDNFRASLLMVITMAGFSVEDLFIKLLAATVPVGQILFLLGCGGTVFFALAALLLRQPLWSADLVSRPFALRSAGEMVSTMAGVTALTLIPLSLAAAILQAAPLLVTIGAALFLGEKVGWRRWSAIGVGIVGVFLILRPGSEGFNPAVWLAVLAVIALAARDLATRATSRRLTTLQLTFWGYALSIIAGGVVYLVMGQPAVALTRQDLLLLLGAQVLGIVFYFTLTLALRIGEASLVVPFRYTRLIFAISLGVLVLDETIDGWMIAGLVLLTASGLYTLLREARLNRIARRASLGMAGPV
jgi:drug/metabolite transporter (DMT)-like permease